MFIDIIKNFLGIFLNDDPYEEAFKKECSLEFSENFSENKNEKNYFVIPSGDVTE